MNTTRTDRVDTNAARELADGLEWFGSHPELPSGSDSPEFSEAFDEAGNTIRALAGEVDELWTKLEASDRRRRGLLFEKENAQTERDAARDDLAAIRAHCYGPGNESAMDQALARTNAAEAENATLRNEQAPLLEAIDRWYERAEDGDRDMIADAEELYRAVRAWHKSLARAEAATAPVIADSDDLDRELSRVARLATVPISAEAL